jgi:hypothetical protein
MARVSTYIESILMAARDVYREESISTNIDGITAVIRNKELAVGMWTAVRLEWTTGRLRRATVTSS